MRIRMQNLVDVDFNEKFEAQDIDARVKRLRLRFDVSDKPKYGRIAPE